MNKNKLVLPIASLLMMPLFVGCNTNSQYEPSFNVDQIVCKYGPSVLDITLGSYVKSKLHFKDELTSDMFELPKEFKGKTVTGGISYNKGASAFILIEDDATDFDKASETVDIKIKKSAFKGNNALDGKISVTFMTNQIKYGNVSQEAWGSATEEGTYDYNGQIELVGAAFTRELIETEYTINSGGGGLITIYKEDQKLEQNGTIQIYDMEGDFYYVDLHINGGVKMNDNIRIQFNGDSTTLGSYKCTFTPSGHDKTGPFLFTAAE